MKTNNEGRPLCDYCEELATMMVQDVLETHDIETMTVTRRPLKPKRIRCGCDSHPVESITFTSNPFMGGLSE